MEIANLKKYAELYCANLDDNECEEYWETPRQRADSILEEFIEYIITENKIEEAILFLEKEGYRVLKDSN